MTVYRDGIDLLVDRVPRYLGIRYQFCKVEMGKAQNDKDFVSTR